MSTALATLDLTIDVDQWPDVARSRQSDLKAKPPGGFSLGSSWQGGPLTTDRFQTQRGPSPWELVEKYKSIIYACVAYNEHAVIKVPLRLYVDGSKPNREGKTQRASEVCAPVPITRSMRQRLVNDHWLEHCRVSPSTVDQVEEVRTHQLLNLLDNPDPYGYFDRTKVLSLICRYTDVCGAAYFVPQRTTMSLVPSVLWPLYSQYVQPVHEAGSPLIDRYIYFADMLPFDAVLRFRLNDSLRDPYGLGYSPLYAAIEYAKLEDAFVSIQDQLLSSGPRPNIVFSPKNADDPPGEVERQRFETDLNRKLSGGNAGRVYVSNGAWDITPISYAPTDLAGKDLSEYDIRMICSCFGIPPTIFTTDTNLANIEAAKEFHAENAVEPRCHMIAAVLTRFARRFDPRLFFAFDPAVREDEEKKNKILLDQLSAGVITINQFSQESQWPPVDYGNEPWISNSLRQPSMIQAEHQMSMTSQASQVENERKANEFQFSDQEQSLDEEQPQEGEEGGQDVQAEARSIALDRMIEQEMRALESELRFMSKGNPYHDDEGHFTGTGGHTGRKPREPAKARPKAAQEPSGKGKATGHQGQASSRPEAKEQPSKSKDSASEKSKDVVQSKAERAKFLASKRQERHEKLGRHQSTKKELADRLQKGKPQSGLSEKAKRAQKAQNKTDSEVQRYTKANEANLAKRLGGDAKSFPDNEPADVENTINGQKRGLELKTLTHNTNDKITISKSAMARKVTWEEKNKVQMDIAILDHRDQFGGGKNADLFSGNEIYYKRGLGSFRISAMHACKDVEELKKLRAMPYDELPKAAQGPIRGFKT